MSSNVKPSAQVAKISNKQEKVSQVRSFISLSIAKIHLYKHTFGNFRGLFLAFASRIPIFKGRVVAVRKSKSRLPIYLRLGTTDIDVFDEVFKSEAYSFPLTKNPTVIIDGGSNIGLTSVWFALLYPESKVIAIEPDEENFKILLRNCASFPNIQPLRAAIWNEAIKLNLEDPGEGAWGYRVGKYSNTSSPTTSHLVQGVTITNIVEKYKLNEISLLKLDVEGSEKEIFENSSEWIGKVKAIMIELHDRHKPGCSEAFYSAIKDFPVRMEKELTVFVARSGIVK
jgi:FkbM family methyltransferase